MLALVSSRNPSITPFCRATYALLEAYARDGGIPPLDPQVNAGAASALLRVSDVLEATGKHRWDDVGPELVELACRITGCAPLLPFVTRTVIGFRRWLVATGRASDAHLADLERFGAELPTTDTLDGTSWPQLNRAARRAVRSGKHWRARHAPS